MRWSLLCIATLVPSIALAAPEQQAVVRTRPIPAAIASAIPEAGIYIAGRSDNISSHSGPDSFYIALLDPSGLRELLRLDDPADGSTFDPDTPAGLALAWIDATHLITLDKYDKYSVFTVAGARKPQQEHHQIADQDWQLGSRADLLDYELPDLKITSSGEAWLHLCHRNYHRCKYLRIWGGKRIATRKPPPHVIKARVAGIRDDDEPTWLAAMPRPTPPKGYKIKIATGDARRRVYGRNSKVTCTGPHGQSVTPDDEPDVWPTHDLYLYGYFPTRARWVITDPPIFAVTGTRRGPMEETWPLVQYRRACENSAIGTVRLLRPRIWGEFTYSTDDEPEQLRLRIDDTLVGSVAGHDSTVAFSPPK